MKKLPGKKRWYLIGVVVFFVLLRIIQSVFAGENIQEVLIEKKDLIQETRVVGDVVAQDEALLGFGSTGRITDIFFEIGDFVEEGQVLARIDLASASAEYSLAAANVNREQARLSDLLDGTRKEEIIIQQDILKVQEESVAIARKNLLQEILNSRSVAEDAIRLKTISFFDDPEGYAKTNFSAPRDIRVPLEEERRDFDLLFKNWLKYNKDLTLESFNPQQATEDSLGKLRRINTFLALLTQASSENDNGQVSAASLQNLASARSAVDAQIIQVQNTLSTYQRSLAEEARQKSELSLVLAGATTGEIATQQAQLQAEQARLQQASSSLFDTKIVAPFSGVITEQRYKIGETVSSGTGVIGVATLDRLEIETFIPEVFIGNVTLGDKAFVSLDAYPNRSFSAEVATVDPKQTDKDGLATYKTTLILSEEIDVVLRLGMTADITIITSEQKGALAVPLEYVIFENNQTYLYKNIDGILEKISVVLGIIDPEGMQEVLSGVEVGDRIRKYE